MLLLGTDPQGRKTGTPTDTGMGVATTAGRENKTARGSATDTASTMFTEDVGERNAALTHAQRG